MIQDFLLSLRDKGLTQEAIASKAGIAQTLVSKLMRGGACNVETLVKLADAFNVTTDEILGRTPPEKEDPQPWTVSQRSSQLQRGLPHSF